MNHSFDLETVDVDGAIREADDATAGDTRAAFFRKAAVGGGAILTSGAIMGMLPELAAAAPSKKQDIAILKFALTLEYLEAAFYKEAVDQGALSDQPLALARLVLGHEKTHVTTLRSAIRQAGSKVPTQPKFDFMNTTKDQTMFLNTAFVLENTGVRAYLGQAGRLKSKKYLGAAAKIVTIEGRHAAAFAILLGGNPFDTGSRSITPSGAFDRASSKGKILGEVRKTKFITG